ncbi:glycosyltransferase family 4 protein [Planktomarina temperata]|nr:glycosyltransferase family 4 protein [Planktomarina temperata]
MMKLAIVQRAVKAYRIPVYRQLSKHAEVRFFYGDDVPGTKTKTMELSGHDVLATKCKTWNIKIRNKWITIHLDLIKQLKEFEPDVILVEGESHFIGALQCKIYQRIYCRKVPLMKWCFIELPKAERSGLRFFLKYIFQKVFDVFILYSSFSAKSLDRYRIEQERGFVAVNVGDIEGNIRKYHKLQEVNKNFDLNNFTVAYVGNFDPQKNFHLVLDIAEKLFEFQIDVIVAGDGPQKAKYEEIATKRGLSNITFLGHVTDMADVYCRADIVYIPGRGGMVISEALAFACPVIVHAADGTEYDLVKDNITGFILPEDVDEVAGTLLRLKNERTISEKLGTAGQDLVSSTYSTKNMAQQILNAAQHSIDSRRKYV